LNVGKYAYGVRRQGPPQHEDAGDFGLLRIANEKDDGSDHPFAQHAAGLRIRGMDRFSNTR
jgi:hypothetical protein